MERITGNNGYTGKIAVLLANPAAAKAMGDRGQHAVVANQGAMDRCIEKIVERLNLI